MWLPRSLMPSRAAIPWCSFPCTPHGACMRDTIQGVWPLCMVLSSCGPEAVTRLGAPINKPGGCYWTTERVLDFVDVLDEREEKRRFITLFCAQGAQW